MRVLVTGAAGCVARYVVDYLNKEEVHGLDRWGVPWQSAGRPREGMVMHEGDLLDMSSVISLLREVKPDVIVHLAAQSFVPTSFNCPGATLANNGLGTLNLLEAVRLEKQSPRILIVSSPEVYGDVPEEELPITEHTPLRPVNPYALSKATEDLLGLMYHEAYGLHTIITRAFAHEAPGRGPWFAVSNFALQIARIEAGLQEPMVKVGNLKAIRTYGDVRDTVRAYWLALEKGSPGEVYNIAGDRVMTVGEVLDLLLELSGLTEKVGIEVDPSRLRPRDVPRQLADDSKFRQLTGWRPLIPFEQTLQEMLDHWRRNVDA
jgi:GDP-mannose 4,6-dehydratase